MGREIRQVQPNRQHPADRKGRYLPLQDRTHEDPSPNGPPARSCRTGDITPQLGSPEARTHTHEEWCEESLNPQHHRPAFQQEPTWHQVYSGFPVALEDQK